MISATDQYNKIMHKEIDELELEISLSNSYRIAFIHGYKLAAHHWHHQGLLEGWNDHIKKLNQLMKLLPIDRGA
ncbi:hypothetical protein KA005_14460 [bacterium]|nr:hypothetical protein [bacterium]